MTDQAIAQELHQLREAVITLTQFIGPRLTREQVRARLGVSNPTLNKRIESGQFPRAGRDGKWLLSEVLEWERR